MKKSVVYLCLVLLAGVLSCRKAEKEQGIASRVDDDSIALIEDQQQAAEEEAKAEAEQARLDSIRRDSLRQESIRKDSIQKDFENQFITPLDLVEKVDGSYRSKSGENLKKILRAKGYKIQNEDENGYEWTAKKVDKNPITGAFYKSEIQTGCGARCIMWIEFPNKQDAKNFYKKLDKYNSTYRLNETEFRKMWELEGNTIDVII